MGLDIGPATTFSATNPTLHDEESLSGGVPPTIHRSKQSRSGSQLAIRLSLSRLHAPLHVSRRRSLLSSRAGADRKGAPFLGALRYSRLCEMTEGHPCHSAPKALLPVAQRRLEGDCNGQEQRTRHGSAQP